MQPWLPHEYNRSRGAPDDWRGDNSSFWITSTNGKVNMRMTDLADRLLFKLDSKYFASVGYLHHEREQTRWISSLRSFKFEWWYGTRKEGRFQTLGQFCQSFLRKFLCDLLSNRLRILKAYPLVDLTNPSEMSWLFSSGNSCLWEFCQIFLESLSAFSSRFSLEILSNLIWNSIHSSFENLETILKLVLETS